MLHNLWFFVAPYHKACSSTWICSFRNGEFKSFKKRSCLRNFDHCGPRLVFVLLLRFWSTKQVAEKFFLAYQNQLKVFWPRIILTTHSIITVIIHLSRVIKLYKHFYKINSRHHELHNFLSVDYSSCFDFTYMYFRSHVTTPCIKLSCKWKSWWTEHIQLIT